MAVLVLNAGSSSLKGAVFESGVRRAEGRVEAIGEQPVLWSGPVGAVARRGELPDGTSHDAALAALLEALDAPIDAVGHRVVHGGERFRAPTRLDEASLTAIDALSSLAPLHNPVALKVIHAARAALPDAPQVACFDTAFHAGQSDLAIRYALPTDDRTAGLRRYGFHGLSYQGVVDRFAGAPPRRLLACHLGAGASLCAIRDGMSVATTMGWSPLDGIGMATRSGSVDPAVAIELARRLGPDVAERLLNRESGLLGLSGISGDMRRLEESQDPRAAFAIEHYVYWIARHAGSMIAAMEGLDAIVFTGGIGENAAAIRQAVCARLAWTGLAILPDAGPGPDGAFHAAGSAVAAHVVRCDEEAVIARGVAEALR